MDVSGFTLCESKEKKEWKKKNKEQRQENKTDWNGCDKRYQIILYI